MKNWYISKPHISGKTVTYVVAVFLAVLLALPAYPAGERGFVHGAADEQTAEVQAPEKEEVKGLWIAMVDFEELGLRGASEKAYRKKLDGVLKKAAGYGTNMIYFHVRAYDDAMWKSKTFKASSSLSYKATNKKVAADVYTYDPLAIAIELAHKRNMKIEGWLNPYRITTSLYYDPSSPATISRVMRAVEELKAYDLDGIHFDDYFYHSPSGKYRTITSAKAYNIYPAGTVRKLKRTKKQMRSDVNKLVRSVYSSVHEKEGMIFGISPAGNYDNCMDSGVDVKTWLSKPGYVDYLLPQIYWTDNWGSRGRVKMYSNRLVQFKSLNKIDVDLYVGLALYQAGTWQYSDRGWGMRSTNLRTQVKKLRASDCEGYALFRAAFLYKKSTKKELYKLKGLVKPVKAKSVKFTGKKMTVKKGKKRKLVLKWNPASTNPKTVKFKVKDKRIATVTKEGVVKGKKRGKTVLTATIANGKKAVLTVYVK